MQADVEMTEPMVQNGDGESDEKRKPGETGGGMKMKKMKAPGEKNLKNRRYVQPKSAVMCLNELLPGLTYAVEQEGGYAGPFCIAVKVNGRKFRGYGSSKQLAKQAAAEAALISFIKSPALSGTKGDEDKTPWATLAAFGIYKLFNDWREGRIGVCTNNQAFAGALPPDAAGMQPLLGRAINALAKSQGCGDAATLDSFNEVLSAHLEEHQNSPKINLGGRGDGAAAAAAVAASATAAAASDGSRTSNDDSKGNVFVPNPAKQMPENAAEMHPVTLLHQMHPGLAYNTEMLTKDNKPYLVISATINGKKFTGEGGSVKKAKVILAKEAIKCLYGIRSTFGTP